MPTPGTVGDGERERSQHGSPGRGGRRDPGAGQRPGSQGQAAGREDDRGEEAAGLGVQSAPARPRLRGESGSERGAEVQVASEAGRCGACAEWGWGKGTSSVGHSGGCRADRRVSREGTGDERARSRKSRRGCSRSPGVRAATQAFRPPPSSRGFVCAPPSRGKKRPERTTGDRQSGPGVLGDEAAVLFLKGSSRV